MSEYRRRRGRHCGRRSTGHGPGSTPLRMLFRLPRARPRCCRRVVAGRPSLDRGGDVAFTGKACLVDGGGPTAAYKATSKTGFGGLIIAAAPTDEDNSAARTTPCGVAVKAADLGKQTFAKQRSSAANTDIPAGDPSGHVHNARRGNAYFTATDLPTKDSNGL